MRLRTIVLTASVPTVLLLSAGGVLAYDAARPHTVADGVRVAGVDIGGLSRADATAKLDRQLTARLGQPIVVHHDSRTWTLTAQQAKVTADADAMVGQVLSASDRGGMLRRSWRRLTGGTVRTQLTPQVRYSGRAVTQLMHTVGVDVNRRAHDAAIHYSSTGIGHVPSVVGLRVQKGPLRRGIEAALVDPAANHTFVATTDKLRPSVTTTQLAQRYGTVLVASRTEHKLRLFKNLKLVKTYGIAVGMAGLETPQGLFHVQNKAVNPAWNVPNSAWAGSLAGTVIPGGAPNNPIVARWMGIYDGVGIHGTTETASIGSSASHGCMRMLPADVIDLYPRVPVGATVYID